MEAFTYLFVFAIIWSFLNPSNTLDTITPIQSIRDGDTLVSASRRFQLGFFSPGNSKGRYVGIWYTKSSGTVVWVANRDTPLNDHSGVLKVANGAVILLNSTNSVAWSSNTSRTAENPVLELLDNGNLVVKDEKVDGPVNYLWQSFDYPGDTSLPEMKLGKNLVTGLDRFLTSWKSTDDPAQGEFSLRLDLRGLPQVVVMQGDTVKGRVGSWNGLRLDAYSGLTPNPLFEYEFHFNEREVYYEYKIKNNSVFTRYILNPSGIGQHFTWLDRTNRWEPFAIFPADQCANYAFCGAYASCKVGNIPVCACLEGFIPKSPKAWDTVDWSDGCVRKTPLNCSDGPDGNGFRKYTRFKLPDTSSSWFDKTISLKECEELCLKNCSCTAYGNLDIRMGGSGCLLWFGNLVDIREIAKDGDNQIYVRLAASELDHTRSKLLDWHNRIDIIGGIARGLLYLHQDSRLRIIHRDLKTSNILLDDSMNPKISDFGLARIFGGDQTEAKTKRIVGTHGYMSPEYAGYGQFSIKSDVFSFGVLVLEIMSGKRNRGFCHLDDNLNLLGLAWRLWTEDQGMELIDESIGDMCTLSNQVLRCIHVGLLCVQQRPEDRPDMSSVVLMLSSEILLPKPRQPGFYTEKALPEAESSLTKLEQCSTNEITITLLEGR
ncbi:hypothetical protein SO802_034408 [Lithocarpus litseifolius]|uniref:non-specific serine/threonine protein kinase n=1 Tax=Lithocarpus litseifolius TaxID=425828 RepID=A0AAW2BHI3_9ROSI